MYNILRNLDFFGGHRGLSYNGTLSFKTLIGSIFSAFFFLCIFLSAGYYVNLFRTREKRPKIFLEETHVQKAPKIDLKENNFFFTFTGVYDGSYVLPDDLPKIVDIKVEQVSITIDKSSKVKFNRERIPIKRCKESDFFIEKQLIVHKPSKSPCRYSLCIEPTHLKMDDDFIQDGIHYVEISFNKCTKHCRDDVDEILDSNKLQIIFGHSESSLDLHNVRHPFAFNYNTNRWFHCLTTKTFSRKLFMGKVEVKTDVGYFSKKFVHKSGIKFLHELNEDTDRDINDPTRPYVKIRLYSGTKLKSVTRSYDKLQDLLKNIGGIASVMSMTITVIYGFYNRVKLELHILNHSILKPYVQRAKSPFTLSSIIQFHLLNILSMIGLKKLFSAKVRIRSKMYFTALMKLNDHLEIVNIVKNSRDCQIFSSMLIKGWQARVLRELEVTGMINNKDYFKKTVEEEIEEEDLELKKSLKWVKDHSEHDSWEDCDSDDDVFEWKVNKFLKRKIDVGMIRKDVLETEKAMFKAEAKNK